MSAMTKRAYREPPYCPLTIFCTTPVTSKVTLEPGVLVTDWRAATSPVSPPARGQ